MNDMSLFFIINLVFLLYLNAKPKFYLVETDDEYSTSKYADYEYSEVLLENFKPSKISNDTDYSSEISKKGRRFEAVTAGYTTEVPAEVTKVPGSECPPNRVINSTSRSLTNYTDCGIKAKTGNNRNRRVFGGEQTEENEIPWMCATFLNGIWKNCGATLLNCDPIIILTAAHCVDKAKPQSLQVACGAYRISARAPSSIDKNEIRLQVTDVVIHPEFTGKFGQLVGSKRINVIHDIAILKVENSLICSKGIIYPACLPTKGYEYTGWNSLASGWGLTSNSPFAQSSPTLLKIKIPIVSDATCQPMCSVYGCDIFTQQMCAGGEQNKALCGSDSGGPLVAEDNLQQGWSLIGIQSIGHTSCGSLGTYNILTEVSYYLDWIAQQFGLDQSPTNKDTSCQNSGYTSEVPAEVLKVPGSEGPPNTVISSTEGAPPKPPAAGKPPPPPPPKPPAAGGCFPGTSMVMLDGGEKRSMEELRIGDTIMTVENGKLESTRVLGFLDKKINQTAYYINLILKDNRNLFISSRHAMFIKGDNNIIQSILAGDVSIGDMVIVDDGKNVEFVSISDITVELKMGAYVPLTHAGTLLVDGVLVSSYTNSDHWLAHITLSPLRWWPTLLLDTERSQNLEGLRIFPHLMRTLGRILGLITMVDGKMETIENPVSGISQLAMEKMDKTEF